MTDIFMYVWIIPFIILAACTTKDRIGFAVLSLLGFLTWSYCLFEYLKVMA